MALDKGTPAPNFTLKNQFGEEVSLSDFAGKKNVVLMFYPLAFSGICTGELCELRDNMALFRDANVELIAVSVDSHFTLRAFADQEKYDFNLLSDFWPHGEVALQYGVFVSEAGIANRATFVINQSGTIVDSFITEPGQPRDLERYRKVVANL